MAFQADGMKAQSPATLSSDAWVLGEGGEERVGAHEVEADGVVLEHELGRDDDGDVAIAARGHKVTEAVGLDEGTPLRLAEGGVSRGDVHRVESAAFRRGLELLYRLGPVAPVVDLAVGGPPDGVDDAHPAGGLVPGQPVLDVAR